MNWLSGFFGLAKRVSSNRLLQEVPKEKQGVSLSKITETFFKNSQEHLLKIFLSKKLHLSEETVI